MGGDALSFTFTQKEAILGGEVFGWYMVSDTQKLVSDCWCQGKSPKKGKENDPPLF